MRFVMGSAEGLGNSPLPANQAVPKCYGVTKPISMAGPCDTDVQRNKELEKVLIDKFWLPFSARFEISMVDFFFFFVCLVCGVLVPGRRWLVRKQRGICQERRGSFPDRTGDELCSVEHNLQFLFRFINGEVLQLQLGVELR